MTTKNALLKSIKLFVDLTTTHLTLYFEYSDSVQMAGPYVVTDDLLRALATITGEREVLKITNKPCRIQVDENRDAIVAISHFLKDEWFFPLANAAETSPNRNLVINPENLEHLIGASLRVLELSVSSVQNNDNSKQLATHLIELANRNDHDTNIMIDTKNLDHMVETAHLILKNPSDVHSRELAELFLAFAKQPHSH